MNCVLTFLIPLMVLLQLNHIQARTVTVPKRETAQVYYLKLTNLSTQESIILKSKNEVFELPENLEGRYSLQVSFTDKWGREVLGRGPKIIQLNNKLIMPEIAAVEESPRSVVGIIFTPYSASGTYQADLNDPLTTVKKMSGTFNSLGINTILKISTIEKWKLGLDIMQGQNTATQLNTTEISIIYEWRHFNDERKQFLLSSGASYVSSQIKDNIQSGTETINSSATAKSAYVYGNGVFSFSFADTSFATTGLFGVSNSYIRYHIGQSILYSFSKKFSLGPWIDYVKFENGNKDGAIKANFLKLGFSFNFIL